MRSGRVHLDESDVAQQSGRSEEGWLVGNMAAKQGRCRIPAADWHGNARRNRRVLLFFCDQGQQRPMLPLQQIRPQASLVYEPHPMLRYARKVIDEMTARTGTAQSVGLVAKDVRSSTGRASCILNTGDMMGSRRLRGRELRVMRPQT